MCLLTIFGISSNVCAQLLQQVYIDGGYSHSYAGGIWGGGVSLADFNGDGIDDVTLARNGDRPLFLLGSDSALQVIQLPFPVSGEIKQVCWVDIDNDGDRDLSVSGFNLPFMIFEHTGELELSALDSSSGIAQELIVGYGHSWGDYDRDGDLDVFVCNYDAAYMGFMDADNRLYRNDGNMQFTDVTLTAGFTPMVNYTFMALWMDYNRDLYPDLLVINDRYEVPNYFYHNNGDGTFTEIGESANLQDFIFGMTATSDDYDNDGDLDIYITNGTEGNLHKRNNGDGTFTNVEEYLATEVNHFCWSAQFIDLNRDGWQDLHVCSSPFTQLDGVNFALFNAQVVFQDSTEAAGIAEDHGWSRSSAVGDFNDDGMADLVVSKTYPDFSSYWTGEENNHHWLKVELVGAVSNREGVSSWIDAYAGELHQCRFTYCGEGYLGQNSFSEFFGWGEHALLDSLVVSWPSGIVDRWYNIPVNQQLHLVEGTSRRVEVSASNGWSLCAGDSTVLLANAWPSYQWSTDVASMSIVITHPVEVAVEVTDEWGNRFLSDTLSITAKPEVGPIGLEVNPISCFGETDGSIQLNAEGSHWFSMGMESNQHGNFEALSAGIYSCEVENSVGCRDTLTVELTQPNTLEVSAKLIHCTCADASDGSVILNVIGGTPDYTVTGNAPLTELAAGNYELTVVDANGCASALAFTIESPNPLEISCVAAPEWDNQNNGSIAASAEGGIPPYVWILNDALSMEAVWDSLPAGDYVLSVADANGCSIATECSVEAALNMPIISTAALVAYPNPMEQGNSWALMGAQAGSVVQVSNALGQVEYRLPVDYSGVCFPHPLSRGVYILQVLKDDLPQGSLLIVVN